MKLRNTIFTGILLLIYSVGGHTASDSLFQALKTNGHVALMRHALAPGNGDPANFRIGDCSTQRNLSDEGREQALETGDILRANGIEALPVFTSQWCRCAETAQLLNYGSVIELDFLNSFYAKRQLGPAQTSQLKQWLIKRADLSPAILVTHQVNITALTGVYPSSGEIVVLKISDTELHVVGSIKL